MDVPPKLTIKMRKGELVFMSKKLSDELYYELSKRSYDETYDNQTGSSNVIITKDGSQWETIVPKGAKVNDRLSGFDAVVFKNRHTNQIVVAFRGTEGDIASEGWRSVPDFVTDLKDVAIPDWLERSGANDVFEKIDKYTPDLPETPVTRWFKGIYDDTAGEFFKNHNQFYLADQLVKELKKEYPDAHISLTGHSLGGGHAQYAGAMNGVEAVTYSAPSVLYTLPKEMQERAKNGEFDHLITNYVHPNDSIGAGALYEYDRHIGKTYYIENTFEDANESYDGLLGSIVRFWDSIKGDGYHYLHVYEFDKDGYISNELYDAHTDEKLNGSPRKAAHAAESGFYGAGMGGRLASSVLLGAAAGAAMAHAGGSRTIQVTPEQLKEVGQRLKQQALSFHEEMTGFMQCISQALATSDSRRLRPIAEGLKAEMTAVDRWYMERISSIAEFIAMKGHQFEQADRAGLTRGG